MERFEELQAIWQAQPQPAAELETLRRSLHGYGRQQRAITLGKIATVTAILAAGAVQLHGSPLSLAGLACVGAMAGLLMAMDWRAHRAIARLEFAHPSAAFVKDARARLLAQREPFRKYYWAFAGSLVLIENVLLIALNQTRALAPRIAVHAGGTLLPLAACEGGRRLRIWRFDRECRPVLDRLDAVERSLEEDAR